MRLIVGLTGPTGAGKSNLCDTAKQLGFKVIDCDKSARKATVKGSEGLKALCLVFGNDILNKQQKSNETEGTVIDINRLFDVDEKEEKIAEEEIKKEAEKKDKKIFKIQMLIWMRIHLAAEWAKLLMNF